MTTTAAAQTIDIHEVSLDATALFFIVDRVEEAFSRGDDAVEEALAMARVARQMALKLDLDLKALSLRAV
ncbi:hypothetical protein [Affinirhizobium pseudoryzae]|uniref:hypothetical protein n=1 Tax=Allorhizobium pseudoryzae TaxID=379684 RepID=UPI0013EC565F|nr:hypothetical protein [Allorhizobium pseudoryzae]